MTREKGTLLIQFPDTALTVFCRLSFPSLIPYALSVSLPVTKVVVCLTVGDPCPLLLILPSQER